jgi:SAM-dependent methyltransferase
MQALEVVGSDLNHHECPACGCHDRERHLLLYLRASGLLKQMVGMRVLHLAPERYLRNVLREIRPIDHVMGDLFPESSDIAKLDVTALPYGAESFDMVIANHLLEHVNSANKALTEISRVLRPYGYAILNTPFSPVLKHTFEDDGISAPDKRLQAYGQEDHVRLFGRDIVNFIERFGFESHVRLHTELLSDIDPSVYGVNAAEPFMLFVRKTG